MDETVKQGQPACSAGIALVTDSTCDLPEAEKSKYVVAVVPLHVQLGGTSYIDRIDLDSAEFFRKFRENGQLAQSSQPSVGEFAEVYAALLQRFDAVVSVHIAARLSGTVQSATMAADAVDPGRVRVVDARNVSVGLGLVVQAAGEAILAGGTLDGVAAAAEAAASATRVYGALPSLDAAVRGGRLNARAARVGALLDLKPLIVFDEEGGVHAEGARLGYPRALRAVAERVAAFASGGPARVSLVHADGLDDARYLSDRLRLLMGDLDIPILEAGAVITTHVGLGTVAVGVRRTVPPALSDA